MSDNDDDEADGIANGGLSDDYIMDEARQSAYETACDLTDSEDEAERLFGMVAIDICAGRLARTSEFDAHEFATWVNAALKVCSDYRLTLTPKG